jgi:REP element-mobilizing transposase RayT
MIIKTFYRRNLPHFQYENSVYFITYRLFNSLQKEVIGNLKNYYYSNKNSLLKIKDEELKSVKLYELQRRYFGMFDRQLDTNKECINYLSHPEIAKITIDSLKFWDGKRYELLSYCLMPNHVHLLIYVERFIKPLYRIMQSIKRHSSRESNKIINRTGAFWHEENFDHIVRSGSELERIINYMMTNPLKAGLVNNANEWKWRYCKFGL